MTTWQIVETAAVTLFLLVTYGWLFWRTLKNAEDPVGLIVRWLLTVSPLIKTGGEMTALAGVLIAVASATVGDSVTTRIYRAELQFGSFRTRSGEGCRSGSEVCPPFAQTRWLNLLADLHINLGNDVTSATASVRRIEQLCPNTAFAEQAKTRLSYLKTEAKRHTAQQTVKLGNYEKDLGLKSARKGN